MSIKVFFVSLAFPLLLRASLPEIPFSGSLGATAGAGASLGWERNGFGVNPAVSDPGTMAVSLAAYSPFGLDGVEVAELGVSRNGHRWGTSLSYRGLYDSEGGSVSALQGQQSFLVFRGLTVGLSERFQKDESGEDLDGGAGLLWNLFSFLAVGGFTETSPRPWGRTLNNEIGFDFGGKIEKGYDWRVCAEALYNVAEGFDWRLGTSLQLHSLLSLYGGWSPAAQTLAFGIRFGMGNFEGFSALRRHTALGTTSIQGLGWRKEIKP